MKMNKNENNYLILNHKPIRCIINDAHFTRGKNKLLDVYFALFGDIKIRPIIVLGGMGMGAAVIFTPDSQKEVAGYFVEMNNLIAVKTKNTHKLGFNIFQIVRR